MLKKALKMIGKDNFWKPCGTKPGCIRTPPRLLYLPVVDVAKFMKVPRRLSKSHACGRGMVFLFPYLSKLSLC